MINLGSLESASVPDMTYSVFRGMLNLSLLNQSINGKRVVNFLLVLIQLLSLGVTVDALRANIGSKSAISLQGGPVDPKFEVEGVDPNNHFFLSEN